MYTSCIAHTKQPYCKYTKKSISAICSWHSWETKEKKKKKNVFKALSENGCLHVGRKISVLCHSILWFSFIVSNINGVAFKHVNLVLLFLLNCKIAKSKFDCIVNMSCCTVNIYVREKILYFLFKHSFDNVVWDVSIEGFLTENGKKWEKVSSSPLP